MLRSPDFDPKALAYFRKRAAFSKRLSPEILQETDVVLIDKLHLKEGTHLKRAAVLLFHADPERFITGAFVKIGFFRSNAELLYHDEVHGDLFTQVNQTLELLLTKYTKAMISYRGVCNALKPILCRRKHCAKQCSMPSLTKTMPAEHRSRSVCMIARSCSGIRANYHPTGQWND